MDIKKILFKYGDKIIFLAFLLLFLFSALQFISNPEDKVNIKSTHKLRSMDSGDKDMVIREDARLLKEQIDVPPISPTLTSGGFATDPDKIEPIPGKEKVCPKCFRIVPIDLEKCPECGHIWRNVNDDDHDGMPNTWEDRYEVTDRKVPDADKDPDGDGYSNIEEYYGGSDPGDSTSVPKMLVIAETGKEPVDILFDGFVVNPGGDIEKPSMAFWVLQINWGRKANTSIIPYGGYFHGYRLYPLVKTTEEVFNPAINAVIITEIWTLTIQKKGRPKIKVRMKETAVENEPYVKFRITSGPDKGRTSRKLYDTEKIRANGIGYTILKVTEDKVLIQDEKGNVITVNKK